MNQYILSMVPILFFRKPFKAMPGYIMGGHLYTSKRKPITKQVVKVYETGLKKLLKEMFE
jgi:hypothetical protein